MQFTGERFIPDLGYDSEIGIEHIQRYKSIQKIVKDKIVLDAACGEGYGTNIISQYAKKVYGIDISSETIEEAKRKYACENIEFKNSSIEDLELHDNSIDIVVSFETIEHVDEDIQKRFLEEVRRVLKNDGIFIVSTPNKEIYSDAFNYTNEFHKKEFYEDEFKIFLLKYFKNVKFYNQTVEANSLIIEEHAKEISILNEQVDVKGKYIIAICSNDKIDEDISVNTLLLDTQSKHLTNIKRIIDLQERLTEVSLWGQKLDGENKVYIKNIEQLRYDIQTQIDSNKALQEIIERKDKELRETIKRKRYKLSELERQKNDELSNLERQKNDELSDLERQKNDKLSELERQKNDELSEITKTYENTCQELAYFQKQLQTIYDSNLWKVATRYYRIRDKFKLTNFIHSNVNKIIKEKDKKVFTKDSYITKEEVINSIQENKDEIYLIDESVKKQNYDKPDIILLSVIDWDFRFQRPQHIARNLAKLGHRVFYFNANYNNKDVNVSNEEENLYIVKLSDYYSQRIYDIDFNTNPEIFKKEINNIAHRYNIRECTIIVEYPTWEPIVRYLKETFGFRIIFDYIDDYTGFEETNNKRLASVTKELLYISDMTIATSDFLAEKARQYSNNVEIVRNGTEFEFFNQAVRKEETINKNPKIGYYGAIAEWFDIEKIEYIAQNRPEIQIELIGNVSCDKCNVLKKYKNITFLGEKDYNDLPKYLKEYDVCLIPFKSDIDLIKATNPVKFYEYLSAGKKIVATEIPELELFRDKYVYLANDKIKFLHYVDLCIANEDQLLSTEELIDFAKTHDWVYRCEMIDKVIKDMHPLVSIIVVTYNNLHYTKQCIESIISKTAYPNYEIVIVDNDSKDETPQYLKELQKKHTNIRVILSDTNTGFAGGNNIGIKECRGDYIILLNNDTLVTRGWITGLIKHLDKENIGFIGPVTNSIGNESQINIEYTDIKNMDEFAIRYTTNHHNELYNDINILAMFCVAIKREVLEEIGLLDENYIVGMFEDDDYSMALKQKGYKVACAEDVFIHHFGNVSFKKLEDKKYMEIFQHNKKYYEEKWNTVWIPHRYRDGVGN